MGPKSHERDIFNDEYVSLVKEEEDNLKEKFKNIVSNVNDEDDE